MKKIVFSLLASTLCFNAHASLKVVSGNCQLESTQEVIELKNIDPNTRFGMFASGISSQGHQIYLTENFRGSVHIAIQSTSGGGYSITPLAVGQDTRISFGVLVKNQDQPDWFSCSLTVR